MLKLPIFHFKPKNGSEIVLCNYKKIPLVAISLYLKVGSKNDFKCKEGLAHFAEHLLFSEEKEEVIKSYAYFNAKTTEDYTKFYWLIHSKFTRSLFKKIAKRIREKYIKEKEFLKEKKIILNEFQIRKKRAYRIALETLYREIFRNTPYSHPAIGNLESINSISFDDVKEFINEYYTPQNTIISVTGGFSQQKIIKLIKDNFNLRNSLKEVDNFSFQIPQPERKTKRIKEQYLKSASIYVGILVPGRGNEYNYPLNLLPYIFSKRFEKIRRKEKETVFISSSLEEKKEKSLFIFFIKFEKRIFSNKILNRIFQEIEEIKKGGIDSYEIERAKSCLILDFLIGISKSLNLSQTLAEYILFENNPHLINKEIDKFENIKKDEIMFVLSKFFSLEKAVIVESVIEND